MWEGLTEKALASLTGNLPVPTSPAMSSHTSNLDLHNVAYVDFLIEPCLTLQKEVDARFAELYNTQLLGNGTSK